MSRFSHKSTEPGNKIHKAICTGFLCIVATLLAGGLSACSQVAAPTDQDGRKSEDHVTIVDESAPAEETTTVSEPVQEATSEPEPAPESAPVAPSPPPTSWTQEGVLAGDSRSFPGVVVALDPGHQLYANDSQEPLGPGSSTYKPKVSPGATGVTTGIREHELNLSVALKVKEGLEARGITVVMIRETADVNISNAERARIANDAASSLCIRIHADSSADRGVHGIYTLIPSSGSWTSGIHAQSSQAGSHIHNKLLSATGAFDRGIKERSDLSGFNYSTVPVVLVELGVMSNPDEDRLMSTSEYQTKLAQGIVSGTLDYLEHR